MRWKDYDLNPILVGGTLAFMLVMLFNIYQTMGYTGNDLIQATLVTALVVLTGVYAYLTECMLNESKKDRKQKRIENKLEKLYFHLINNRDFYIMTRSWNNTVNKYFYLASEELKPLLSEYIEGMTADGYYDSKNDSFYVDTFGENDTSVGDLQTQIGTDYKNLIDEYESLL